MTPPPSADGDPTPTLRLPRFAPVEEDQHAEIRSCARVGPLDWREMARPEDPHTAGQIALGTGVGDHLHQTDQEPRDRLEHPVIPHGAVTGSPERSRGSSLATGQW